jgi:cell division protein FtsQ
MGLPVVGLTLSTRGSWLAKLSNGAAVELGRGNNKEIEDRVKNFTSTLTQVSQRYERRVSALESADLRHENGYALKLKGLTTVDLQPVKR